MIPVLKISSLVEGNIIGNKGLIVEGVCDIEIGKKSYITYVKDESYEKYLKESAASVAIIHKDVSIKNIKKTFIVVENPSLAFIKVLNLFNSKPLENKRFRISSKAEISENAKISSQVYIGPNVIVEDNAIIEDDVKIEAGSFIGENSRINNRTHICANVTIHHDVIIGKNCRIDSNTVIGSEGFGIISVYDDKKKLKNNFNIPHIGKVIISDNVTIGSNCSIDRGTINDTIIGKNTKMDNLIQIGHNVQIGENCLIAAQTGIAGSAKIGNDVTLAGQSGIINHVTIGKGSIVAVKSCVYKTIKPNSFVSGIPARDHSERLKQEAVINKLPELYKKLKK